LKIAGYKPISLIDVHGYPSFALWVCGCNLRCPFCHNWRIANADRKVCGEAELGELMVKISKSVKFVDYLHVTGGEPLLQVEALRELFSKVKSLGLMISLNTNLTLASELERLLKDGLLDHVATDLKVPFDIMSGLGEKARNYWGEYLKSLELLRGYEVTLELRVPVARGITLGALGNALREILPLLKGLRKSYCVEEVVVSSGA